MAEPGVKFDVTASFKAGIVAVDGLVYEFVRRLNDRTNTERGKPAVLPGT